MDLENYFKKLIGNIGNSGQQIAKDAPYAEYLGNIGQYSKPAGNIASAMTDMNNPLYQQMYGQFQQQGQHNLAQTIAELSRQNRKLSMMGRTPLFDAERGGEQMFRGLTQNHQDIQDKASYQALTQLNSAYEPAAAQGIWNQKNGYKKAGGTSAILGTLASLFGL